MSNRQQGKRFASKRFASTRIDNIFNPPSKPRSAIFFKSRTNRLPACRMNRRGNDSCRFDGIAFTNRFPVCRIANTKDEPILFGSIRHPKIAKVHEIVDIFRQTRSQVNVTHCNNFEIQNALVSNRRTLLSWKVVSRYKFSSSQARWG